MCSHFSGMLGTAVVASYCKGMEYLLISRSKLLLFAWQTFPLNSSSIRAGQFSWPFFSLLCGRWCIHVFAML